MINYLQGLYGRATSDRLYSLVAFVFFNALAMVFLVFSIIHVERTTEPTPLGAWLAVIVVFILGVAELVSASKLKRSVLERESLEQHSGVDSKTQVRNVEVETEYYG